MTNRPVDDWGKLLGDTAAVLCRKLAGGKREAPPWLGIARRGAQVDHRPRYDDDAMGTDAVRFLVLWMAGWIHSRQLEVIDFLREENHVLREQLGERRLRFTDDQRRRLDYRRAA
jgi:hypothetical protein